MLFCYSVGRVHHYKEVKEHINVFEIDGHVFILRPGEELDLLEGNRIRGLDRERNIGLVNKISNDKGWIKSWKERT